MKITLISLRTEGSPSKFINNGSRQGESRALGQISKPGEAAGAVFARQEVLLWFKPGLEAAGGHRGDGDGCDKQDGRSSTGVQGLLLHQHRSLGARGCAPITPTRSPHLQKVVNEALVLNAGGKGPMLNKILRFSKPKTAPCP